MNRLDKIVETLTKLGTNPSVPQAWLDMLTDAEEDTSNFEDYLTLMYGRIAWINNFDYLKQYTDQYSVVWFTIENYTYETYIWFKDLHDKYKWRNGDYEISSLRLSVKASVLPIGLVKKLTRKINSKQF